jgi:hypothetical protein
MTPLIWNYKTRKAPFGHQIRSRSPATRSRACRTLEDRVYRRMGLHHLSSHSSERGNTLGRPRGKAPGNSSHDQRSNGRHREASGQAPDPISDQIFRTMDADERQKLWFTPAGEDSEFAEGVREMERLGKVHNMFRWTDEMMRTTKVWKEGDNEDEWNLHDPRMVEGDDGKWEMALPRFRVRQPEPVTILYLRDLGLGPF